MTRLTRRVMDNASKVTLGLSFGAKVPLKAIDFLLEIFGDGRMLRAGCAETDSASALQHACFSMCCAAFAIT